MTRVLPEIQTLPRCAHHGECPGCTDAGTAYGDHLLAKHATFTDLMEPWSPLIQPALGAKHPLLYRHKVQLPFGLRKEGKEKKITLGIYKANSHEIVDQSECHIQDQDLNLAVQGVRAWAQKHHIPVYDEVKGKGVLRYLLLRKAVGTKKILMGIVVSQPLNNLEKIVPSLLEFLAQAGLPSHRLHGIIQDLNQSTGNRVLSGQESLLWGAPTLAEEIGGLHFELGLNTFFQINTPQIPVLYNAISKYVPEEAHVLELFSGTGSIGIWLASSCKSVFGIEINRLSVLAAQRAAARNGFTNIRYQCGDAFEVLRARPQGAFDCVVVDPPRKGLGQDLIDLLNEHPFESLVYVSCNPKSLKSDLLKLEDKYKIEEIQPVDMFPFTEHLESVVILKGR